MRCKLDENLAPELVRLFREAGHEAASVRDQELQGALDGTLWRVCQIEQRCLVTLDLDFANPLAYPPAGTPGIIVLRPPKALLPLVRRLIQQVLDYVEKETVESRLWIAEVGRIRIYDPAEETLS